jgi:hypothetical protein
MPMNPRLLRPLARQAGALPPSGTPASLLLRFDGDFTDSSPNALAVTANGDASISTTTKKWGSGSGYFDGVAGSRVDVEDGAVSFDLDADFTIEAWVYPTSSSGTKEIVTRYDAGNNAWVFRLQGAALAWYAGADTGAYYEFGTVAANEWSHVAISRSGSNVRMFVSGAQVGSTQTNAGTMTGGTSGCAIGSSRQIGFEFPFSGYIDDLRIVKGLAVYQSDYTPPTAALPVNATAAPPASYGTFLFSECVDGDLVGTYADGIGGRYTEVISAGSCS